MLHSCGWLEGGLVSSFEKFVMDADQLGVLHSLAAGVGISSNDQALEAIREVGPGGHYLGCNHTQDNFKEAFWKRRQGWRHACFALRPLGLHFLRRHGQHGT